MSACSLTVSGYHRSTLLGDHVQILRLQAGVVSEDLECLPEACMFDKQREGVQMLSSLSANANGLSITNDEALALARATVNLAKVWELTDFEACALLGGMSLPAWERWKNGSYGRIHRNLRARMADLMGIHRSLRYLFKNPSQGYAWVRKPNVAFGGMSALQIMLRGEISDLAAIRNWLEAAVGSPQAK